MVCLVREVHWLAYQAHDLKIVGSNPGLEASCGTISIKFVLGTVLVFYIKPELKKKRIKKKRKKKERTVLQNLCSLFLF